ncbi:MAG: flagellar hook-basal body complex protein FliE [Alphaproteobacteria bacterium]|nr:flagellar hook-basal body complex protein FliE [Alphaproteobacteria bacterium]MDE2109907.1 flagellar hook-basal body complex protein FliE [Alphaproteobacteria bacterium]MDE2492664.1 flagellar hook-basal body complex protein FliE [Alphaproteobacteria bacterium]
MGASAAAPTAASAAPAAASGAGSFSNFLSDAVKSSIDTIKHGETMATKQITGQANVVDVVNAVNAAELTLDTVVAVRDKVVAAYQSIMNMPI